MRELVVISGKGGTGKTSITAAFACLAQNSMLCDADVDAADLHLLMDPKVLETSDFMGGHKASINLDICMQCGICIELCKFEAISYQFKINALDCEGCGVCVDFCPINAIDFPMIKCGEWFKSETRLGPMVHARLGIAQENSGRLVSLVRQEARKLAESSNRELLITDGPPGVGCPVIASLGGATAVVIVTEPSLSGIHDMERVIQLANNFKVPVMVCINKYDLNADQTEKIIESISKRNIRFLGKIPYDPNFTKAMIQAQTILEYAPESVASNIIREIWEQIIRAPEMNVITELQLNKN
ncbi:P-loop NTPase [bacterium]|nr:P-loop NTPase [bacterium]